MLIYHLTDEQTCKKENPRVNSPGGLSLGMTIVIIEGIPFLAIAHSIEKAVIDRIIESNFSSALLSSAELRTACH